VNQKPSKSMSKARFWEWIDCWSMTLGRQVLIRDLQLLQLNWTRSSLLSASTGWYWQGYWYHNHTNRGRVGAWSSQASHLVSQHWMWSIQSIRHRLSYYSQFWPDALLWPLDQEIWRGDDFRWRDLSHWSQGSNGQQVNAQWTHWPWSPCPQPQNSVL
jgi:hypothetical protein